MPKLPDNIAVSPTVAAIDAYYQKQEKRWRSERLSASTCADPCARRIWLTWRWAYEPQPKDGRILRLFETGHREEARLVDLLRAIGYTVVDVDPETGKQWTVTSLDGHFVAKLDGIVEGVIDAPKARHVLELKTSNAKNYATIVKKGVLEAEPEHWAQMQVEMHLTGIERALYVVKNKDDDAIHSERVRYDAESAIRLFAKLERLIEAKEAPARISEDPKSFACSFCPVKPNCHGGEAAPRNCRTCLHSTPGKAGGGTWSCALHAIVLDRDTQQSGCDRHLYIPSLVPGELVEVDEREERVVYRMADGSLWTDGGTAAPAEDDWQDRVDRARQACEDATSFKLWKDAVNVYATIHAERFPAEIIEWPSDQEIMDLFGETA